MEDDQPEVDQEGDWGIPRKVTLSELLGIIVKDARRGEAA